MKGVFVEVFDPMESEVLWWGRDVVSCLNWMANQAVPDSVIVTEYPCVWDGDEHYKDGPATRHLGA